jgi:two-component sensor histidine kinase
LRAETLLRELQHRVKNNFQVIISFLSQQRRQASQQETQDRISRVMDRVFAIALAHDQLSMSEGGSSVEFAAYLRALCANINPERPELIFQVDADRAIIPLDRAVPAGLIVNELVTNSLKYAFDDSGGTIRVIFNVDPAIGEGRVAVEDDGRGIDASRGAGFGLTLVEGFARQLGGRTERVPVSSGTRTVLYFPIAV